MPDLNERRETWRVCWVYHDGEDVYDEYGPWCESIRTGKRMTPAEVAVQYAEIGMSSTGYNDGDSLVIAVETSPGHALVFRCTKRVTVSIDTEFEDERTDLT